MKINYFNKKNFINQIIYKDLKIGNYKKIKTRFPPEPSGYLHIGHAKSICLNFGIANYYNGKCYLRLDDTNPKKENIKYVHSILKDIKWLGFKWNDKVKYSSDYFDRIYLYAIELIQKGLAYVDELSDQELKKYRGTLKTGGIESPYRNRKINENLNLFQRMKQGYYQEGEMCLRAKIDMSSPFMIMRDPVLYRIKHVTHQKLHRKWCIYPMYDFAHCISDAIEGITHSICTLEFQDNRRLYNWILKNITVNSYPKQYEYARLNIEYTILSKRKLNLLIKNKVVKNWDDPRLLTISGLRRRGYTANSIRQFCNIIGVSKQNSLINMETLESCIRNDLDKNTPRVMAVLNPVKLVIENMFKTKKIISVYNHPNQPKMGIRCLQFTRELYIDRNDFSEKKYQNYYGLFLGGEVRLRYSYIIRANYIEKDKNGNITTIYCTYDKNTLNRKPFDGRVVKGVIHWISQLDAVKAEIRLYNRLFSVSNPEKFKNFSSLINPNSLIIRQGLVERSLLKSKKGNKFQFEREGYFCADIYDHRKNHLVFNRIVSLKKKWKK
ncbi:MAG: glutamine--tRNA ligase [Arsenophonus sp.]|nr:MAG: glutamine--tRNA ligase [Arsenophonus sp.]